MKLKSERGYWTLKKSTLGDYLRGSTWLKKHGKGLMVAYIVIMFFTSPMLFAHYGVADTVPNIIIAVVVIPFVVPLVIVNVIGKILYGAVSGYLKKDVDLPKVEFHTLGTCRNYGKRILNMAKDLNVGDHYIFLMNFHNLFYHEEHRLENPDQGMLNAIGKAVRILPENRRTTTWTKNPFQAIAGGAAAGKEAGEEAIASNIAKKLGAIPEPNEAVAIITKEYLPELMREFGNEVAMLIATVLCSVNNYTGIFPYDDRVVSEKEAIEVATNPTRENVVNYCSKFRGIAVEEPVVERRGLMED